MRSFYTRSDIAKYLNISRMQLYRLEKISRLDDRYKGSHVMWITIDELKDWIKRLKEKIPEKRIPNFPVGREM